MNLERVRNCIKTNNFYYDDAEFIHRVLIRYHVSVNFAYTPCENELEIIERLKKLEGVALSDSDVTSYDLSLGDIVVPCILKQSVDFEPNEWSSTPHDDYYFEFIVCKTVGQRHYLLMK